ncbi:MAG: SH3 domain-containing protein [Cyanothece sp. SIO2G6]|nr:SH3 domain-containing protein [Cyanothece sp. SIO2G6]
MEIFAFTHVAANYEAPGDAPSLREFNLEIPAGAAATSLAGSVAALSVVVSAPDAQAMIRRGAVCAEVGNIQRALVNFNFATGGIDNVFGPATEAAVRNFQASQGLLEDGIVGPTTAASLGVASSCSADSGGTGGGDFATVDASTLNVRTGPSMANAVITTLARGTAVEVTGTSGGWSFIIGGRTEGWVSSTYLSTGGSTGGGTGTPGTYTVATSSGSGVNVRSSPNGARAYGLADGATVSVTSSRQTAGGFTWAELTDGNWVATAFLSSGGGSTGGGTSTFTVDTVSNSGVNVRTSPNGTRAYGLAEGSTVSVTSARQTAGGFTWAELTDGNWVATSFLR